MADEFEGADSASPDPQLVTLLRYFDGDLNAAELAEFNALLRRDPDARRRFTAYCTRGSLLREMAAPEQQALHQREPYAPARATVQPKNRRWVLRAAAAAILFVAVLGAAAWLMRERPAQIVDVGTLERLEGDVKVLNADGTPQASAVNMRVRSGDTIRTHGAQSIAVLAYADGTRLSLVGDANLTCSEAGHKGVVMHEGTLLASVARQPEGAPMHLTTPSAQVHVRGTRFVMATQADQTDVKVSDGEVSVIRSSDGKRFDVPAGKHVLTGLNSESAVEDILKPPDTWKVDFAHGLPKGWTRGEFTSENLPRGSRGAIKAVKSKKFADVFEIASPEMWFDGLFSVQPDSYLSFTFKMDKPDWINVFIIARNLDSSQGPESINYLYNNLRFWPPQPGKWRSISIPLSAFGRAGYNSTARLKDEVPYMVLFSSNGADRGLTIERIEVGRGAPPEVQYRDVE